jgi:hypothetical protein
MQSDLFAPTPEGEARLLLLIDAFSGPTKSLEGRTKLAKLDFLLRYPQYLQVALRKRAPQAIWPESAEIGGAIENRMIRYKYGPWDPAYFALLGSLIGRGLVEVLPGSNGLHFKTTQQGSDLVRALAASESWHGIHEVTKLLRRHFDLSGNTLKRFVYETFPEIVGRPWGERI